jgi:transcriptional regulator with XRE-family HTH domain
MNAEWFAGRLRELREAAGLTQQQLADKAGLTREGVAQLETARREPSWRTVVSLCRALAVSCEAFLQEPAAGHEPKPGRPRKATPDADQAAEPTEKPTAKKGKRGRSP